MSYRGRGCRKQPFDLALYVLLIQRLRPSTIIEIGTLEGGSALWFADMLELHDIEGHVVSIDLSPPPDFSDARITFVQGDAKNLAELLPESAIEALGRPLLVIDDGSHLFRDVSAVLDFFDGQLQPGDYVVVEDGNLAWFTDPRFRRYEDGPNRAVADFLGRTGDRYDIDTDMCDFFGYNVTSGPNAWLRRSGA